MNSELRVVSIKGNHGTFQSSWDGNKVHCKYCNQEISFVVTRKGKKIPVDLHGEEPYEPHFANCERK